MSEVNTVLLFAVGREARERLKSWHPFGRLFHAKLQYPTNMALVVSETSLILGASLAIRALLKIISLQLYPCNYRVCSLPAGFNMKKNGLEERSGS